MEFILLRIMKGRLPYRERGLSLYIEEPDQNIMYDSIHIYEDAFDKAYSNGVMIKEEFEEFIFNYEIYTPFDDVELEKLKKENEELKLRAYKNAINKKELRIAKYLLRQNEAQQSKIINKKNQFQHLTCEGVANYCRWNWIIENCTYYISGEKFDWKDINLSTIMSFYENSSILVSDFRAVARSDNWRPIWNLGKKTSNLFEKPAHLMTKDQLLLCSFSSMYDNVYESSESPAEEVINDDDCLDGWFIEQKRKVDKQKKEQQINSMLNPKIANAGEVFILANTDQDIKDIHGMNSPHSEMTRQQRMETIKQKGVVTDLDFSDVRQQLSIQSNQAAMDSIRRR